MKMQVCSGDIGMMTSCACCNFVSTFAILQVDAQGLHSFPLQLLCVSMKRHVWFK